MVITFNCALNIMVSNNYIKRALVLFDEIEFIFKADVVSYSTIVKGLCNNK